MSSQRDYDFGPQLGRGSFGVVYKVTRISDSRKCVCKQINLKSMNKRAREEANKEVALLRKVSHGSPYIVQYMGSFLEDEHLHIIMEFCEKGDLSQLVKSRSKGLDESLVWRFSLQIGLGLRWLHMNRILHRDIKSLNVFLKTNDDVRLGDLGVARVLGDQTNFAHTFVGTPYYLSPELCEEKPYNELSDVWAFGCVIYEMCTLRHPFEAKNQAALLIKILRGQFAPIDASYSDDLRNLIDGCMRREWTKRTKLADMLASASARSRAEELGIALEQEGTAAPAASRKQHPPKMPIEKRTSPRQAALTQAGGAKAAVPKVPPARRLSGQNAPRTRVRMDPRGTARPVEAARTVLVAPPAKKTQPLKPSPSHKRKSESNEVRLAAREVAELPDVVVAQQSSHKRNVPSVQQLLSMDDADSPIKRMLLKNGGRLTKAAQSATLAPEEVLNQAFESVDETTIRPEDVDETSKDTDPLAAHILEQVPDIFQPIQEDIVQDEDEGEGALDDDFEQSVSEDEFCHPQGETSPTAPGLRLLHPRDGELTYCSAFDGEDSLAYSLDDTMGDTLGFTAQTDGYSFDCAEEHDPTADIEVKWGITEHSAAKLDSDGLLCDKPMAELMCSPEAEDAEEADEVEEAEELPRLPPEPAPAPTRALGRAPPDPQAQVARLAAQISRLYADVVKELDAPARAVWDELYGLFQAKMAVDLTDEDQSEIERYVFEHLPTESTDLIWKVYRVLHLEQERDRWQRLADP
eukprot:TRINITY_DN51497_c0_g1_i1.p1 TRINITY_DN51497_c0_g1~~TRINITY_DN51497_c0_g1_i1.p1  ORF type:complete len:749 (-),score=165.51 TRINITY_DN51497_c0_g1_i1:12-2258(-)